MSQKVTPSFHQLKPKRHKQATEKQEKPQIQFNDLDDIQIQKGKVITLAYASEGQLKIHTEGINLLNQYNQTQVSFISVLGPKLSGKSYLCDQFLRIFKIQGNLFQKYQQSQEKHNLINIYSCPFPKGNISVFLLDCSFIPNSKQQIIILKTLLILTSTLIFLDKATSSTAQFITKIINISNSLYYQNKNDNYQYENRFYWPKSLLVLGDLLTKNIPKLKSIFIKSEQKHINNQYGKRQRELMFRSVYGSANLKNFGRLGFDGMIIKGILRSIKENWYNNNNIRIIIQHLHLEIYKWQYNDSLGKYNSLLESHFSDQKPKTMDNLLTIFQQISQKVLNEFSRININEQLQNQYQEQILSYITEKEQIIIEINSKKTASALSKIFTQTQMKITHQILQNAKIANYQYDHDSVFIVGNLLKNQYKQIIKKQQLNKIEQQKQQKNKKTINLLKKLITQKQKMLNSILSSHSAYNSTKKTTYLQKQYDDLLIRIKTNNQILQRLESEWQNLNQDQGEISRIKLQIDRAKRKKNEANEQLERMMLMNKITKETQIKQTKKFKK